MAAFTLKVHILYDMPLASYTPPSSSTTQWVGGVDIHFSNIMCYFPILLPYQILNLEYSLIEKVKEKIHLGDLFKWKTLCIVIPNLTTRSHRDAFKV